MSSRSWRAAALSFVAYSIAAFGSWTLQGPTTTINRESSPFSTRRTSSRPRMTAFARSAPSGSSAISRSGGASSTIFPIRVSRTPSRFAPSIPMNILPSPFSKAMRSYFLVARCRAGSAREQAAARGTAPGRKIWVFGAARCRQAERLAKSPIPVGEVGWRDGSVGRPGAADRCAFVQPHVARGCTTGSPLVQYFRQATQEAGVLVGGAVADADVAGAAEGLAGTDGDFALGEAGEDGGFVGVAEIDPGEVGVGVAGLQADLA